jgi:hypothetical protein
MYINIIKGVGALLPVIIICFIANVALGVALGVARGTPSMPDIPVDLSVAYAWLGTAFVIFDQRTSFRRRFAASLLGSAAGIIARVALGLVVGALLSTGALTETQSLLVIVGPFALAANIGQLVIAYFVAQTIVRRGFKKPSKLATA